MLEKEPLQTTEGGGNYGNRGIGGFNSKFVDKIGNVMEFEGGDRDKGVERDLGRYGVNVVEIQGPKDSTVVDINLAITNARGDIGELMGLDGPQVITKPAVRPVLEEGPNEQIHL